VQTTYTRVHKTSHSRSRRSSEGRNKLQSSLLSFPQIPDTQMEPFSRDAPTKPQQSRAVRASTSPTLPGTTTIHWTFEPSRPSTTPCPAAEARPQSADIPLLEMYGKEESRMCTCIRKFSFLFLELNLTLTNTVPVQVGINYAGTARELNGCVNDAKNVRKFLMSGFCTSSTYCGPTHTWQGTGISSQRTSLS